MSEDGAPSTARSRVDGAEVVFLHLDPDHQLTGVRLWQDLGIAATDLAFAPVPDGWELRLPRPTAHRIEYLFETRDADGGTSSALDLGNPLVVPGPLGEHSVLELPGYTAPPWLDAPTVESRTEPMTVADTTIGRLELLVWSPADAEPDEQLPVLVAHDGPELATYAALATYAGALVDSGALPRMRLALVGPGERSVWYSAELDYAGALVHRVLPAVRETYACAPDVVLAGASLGGLAALHAEWSHPGTFAGLFCQSGSFFTADTDPQEAEFSGFAAVTAFVQRVLDAKTPPSTPYVGLTCGSEEENVHNNRVLAAQLDALGFEVSFAESPDTHNFTAWRDVLDPHLTTLLQRVWRA